ncbi:hypothetical protein BGW80DRAFT_1291239 [Lactifluus volemus]|nr:hypothetical protein BGW80DRAFT_1291239 [Lactifluus volemus]
MAFSEAGSVASSWRSGSVSRAMTHSEAAGHDSTRSADSTAPTSISMSSPQGAAGHAEKHATETGTLLAALADAQHNAQLVERIDDLEAQLVDARAQLRAQQYQPPTSPHIQSHPPPPFVRASQNSRLLYLDRKHFEDADEEDTTYHGARIASTRSSSTSRRRKSGGSDSVFAVPPQNMSLLLQEQPAGSRGSTSSVR